MLMSVRGLFVKPFFILGLYMKPLKNGYLKNIFGFARTNSPDKNKM